MDAKRQFSLAYLFLIVFWFALALALWKGAQWWYKWDGVDSFLLLLMFASIGAGIGGFFKRMWIGASVGAGLMMCLLTLCWGIKRFVDSLNLI